MPPVEYLRPADTANLWSIPRLDQHRAMGKIEELWWFVFIPPHKRTQQITSASTSRTPENRTLLRSHTRGESRQLSSLHVERSSDTPWTVPGRSDDALSYPIAMGPWHR